MTQWVKHQIRVRYQETDQMGVVYHANYLNWFEIGRTEMIRRAGVTYRSLEEKDLLLPLVDAELQFKRPAFYDDIVTVYTRVMALAPVSLTFLYEIRRAEGANGQQEVPAASSTSSASPWAPGSAGTPGSDGSPGTPGSPASSAPSLFLGSEKADKPEGELLVLGRTKHAWVNRMWKPVRLDKHMPELYTLLKQHHLEEG
ncbi:acyl-CoA thioesterase [Paenibacillus senegalensis]|uniref:acyl-CoA thioesterase n=1 Tax=Paenibacillus senegalensis TaxID=1465766 RepID=UPI000287DD67|nr:thioesterase family protein [Paenibacillus senegalensis]